MDTSEVFALLDDASPDGGEQRSRLYSGHEATLTCSDAAGWPHLLADLEQALARGLYAVPLLTYELGEQLTGIGVEEEVAARAGLLVSYVTGRWHRFAKSGFKHNPADGSPLQIALLLAAPAMA